MELIKVNDYLEDHELKMVEEGLIDLEELCPHKYCIVEINGELYFRKMYNIESDDEEEEVEQPIIRIESLEKFINDLEQITKEAKEKGIKLNERYTEDDIYKYKDLFGKDDEDMTVEELIESEVSRTFYRRIYGGDE